MSTAIVISPYESIVMDYLQEVEGYICITDVRFPYKSGKRTVYGDVDILAFNPKSNKFLICEVISYTPRTKKDQEVIERKIRVMSGKYLKNFLRSRYGVEEYEKMLIVWRETPWLKERLSGSDFKLLTFKDIIQRMINYLKEKQDEVEAWVRVSSLTLLILQIVIHFRDELEI